MSDLNQDTLNKGKKKDFTVPVIIILVAVSIIGVFSYIGYNTYNNRAAQAFDKAFDKVLEFNELSNVESKMEMEKELVNLLDQVIANYGKTSSGQRALYYKGYVRYTVGNYEKAQNDFKYFLDKFGKHYLNVKAYYYLSYCYSQLDKTDDAIKTLEVFNDKLFDSYYTPLAFYRLGNLYEIKGNNADALKYYQKIVDEFADSSQKTVAENKVLLLKNNIEL